MGSMGESRVELSESLSPICIANIEVSIRGDVRVELRARGCRRQGERSSAKQPSATVVERVFVHSHFMAMNGRNGEPRNTHRRTYNCDMYSYFSYQPTLM